MPHADASIVPQDIATKKQFYEHVELGLRSLVEGQDFWVSNLANASALLYHSYLGCPQLYGVREDGEPVVNWAGFYILPSSSSSKSTDSSPLLLGPFNGRPACQMIQPVAGRGVCADAFLQQETLIVPNVHDYPGHIACDALSASEIVVPLRDKAGKVVGVLDLDSTVVGTFDVDDREALERLVALLSI